jgi:hypothetical protein
MMQDHMVTRALLVKACDVVGFPPPTDAGLMEWMDSCLDSILQRGGKRWQVAQRHVLDAYECASVGNEGAAADALTRARGVAKAVHTCACVKLTKAVEGDGGHRYCVVCGGRA